MARNDYDDDDYIPTLSIDSSSSHSPRRSHTRRSYVRRLERCCCQTLTYFPLCFVYGLTTWAAYVEVNVSFLSLDGSLVAPTTTGALAWAYLKAGLGLILWGMLNWSYTTAVFVNPGSPLDERMDLSQWRRRSKIGGSQNGRARSKKRGAYAGLPTYEVEGEDESDTEGQHHRHPKMTTVTAKSSTGEPRYCKKCRSVKPDRAHHCSTCGRCVLKMDHHCPWLATCVGLRNYKPFILFLSYTTVFCWLCFAVSAAWVWKEIFNEDAPQTDLSEGLRVINTILLAVLGGIIGLVLGGFTGWHLYLAATGQTTIESLEKTRYLAPLRNSMDRHSQQDQHRHYVEQNQHDLENGSRASVLSQAEIDEEDENKPLSTRLREIHANALPGVLRAEEGDASIPTSRSHTPGPTMEPYQQQRPYSSYASREASRERARYSSYLDEVASDRLPNAFNLGWKRNLSHVFGGERIFWLLPICNTTGDGWAWDVSTVWKAARQEMERAKAEREENDRARSRDGGQPSWEPPVPQAQKQLKWMPGQGFVNPHATRALPPRVEPSWARGANGHSPRASESTTTTTAADLQMLPLDRRKWEDEE